MSLSPEQYEGLLMDLAANRVASRQEAGRNLSYLEAWDVKRHLIRFFGFGGFAVECLEARMLDKSTQPNRKDKDKTDHVITAYALVRLTVFGIGPHSQDAVYTECATGTNVATTLGAAFDTAFKSAESDALKRAAINLGTQFGLSLYQDGSRTDVVKKTLRPVEGGTQGEPALPTDDRQVAVEHSPRETDVEPVEVQQEQGEVEGQISMDEPSASPEVAPSAQQSDVVRLEAGIRIAGEEVTVAERMKKMQPLVNEITHLGARTWKTEGGLTLGRLIDDAMAGRLK